MRTLLRWITAARRVRRAARGADVVLVNSLGALPVVRLARPRAPVVWLAHDVLVRPDRLRLYRVCRGVLARVAAVSAAVAAPLGAGVPVTVVHNGVPWPVPPVDPPAADAVVGINALLTPWKGHQVLLDAVDLLPAGLRVEVMGGHLPTDAAHAAALRAPRRAGAVGGPGPDARPRRRPAGPDARLDGRRQREHRARGLPAQRARGDEPRASPSSPPTTAGRPRCSRAAGCSCPPATRPPWPAAVTRLVEDRDLWRRCSEAGRQRVADGHRLEVQTDALLRVLEQEAEAG